MKRAVLVPPRTTDELRPSIRAVPFQDGPPVLRMTAKEREHLATIANVMRVPAGTVLTHAGQEAKAVFSVTSGTLAAYRERSDGTRKIFAFLFAEDVFGLARRGRYVNSVKAITAAVVFRLPVDALTGLLKRDAPLQFRFLCKVTQVVRDAQRQALMTIVRDPVERVALFLSMMEEAQGGEARHERDTIELPMTRQDVAAYLSLTSASIKAAIETLESRGLIKRMNGAIVIADRARFDALVHGELSP